MMEQLKKRIHVANGKEKADVVIKNGKVVNVFTREVEEADIAIIDGKIAGIGPSYEGHREIDADGKYLMPGFIDGHVHIESSMVTPSRFVDVVVPHGVTSVITDPHEIANVAGKEGLTFMLDDSEGIPLDAYFMLPSCVPATPFENTGAALSAEDLRSFYDHPRVLGLAEVMDYPSVASTSEDMMQKLLDASELRGQIDGHGAGLDAKAMNVFRAAGITTDHECTTAEEAKDRLRRGLYVIIREGSAAKDLNALIPLVSETNSRRFLFCTDDKHLDELMKEGSIDACVRMAVQDHGVDPLVAIQLATINAAECFGLSKKGAIAPSYDADILFVNNLTDFAITHVMKNGEVVAENGKMKVAQERVAEIPAPLVESVKLPEITEATFDVQATGEKVHVIDYAANSLVTSKSTASLPVKNGVFQSDHEQDIMKLAVIERHKLTGNIGLGFIRGLHLDRGAIALTVAHDSHNLVVAGYDSADMLVATLALRDMQGGLVIVDKGEVLAKLPLNLAGLMSTVDAEETLRDLEAVDGHLQTLGFDGNFNPFSALSFMCLPVIPNLKLTDLGYFDMSLGKHIEIVAN
ncbi:adenine deaminase [Paenalkalicoccus suaedae]|uniref:Adenine deaminase n=1 Tax=Paenalkalicoccus suaedae TaxID=2592382 RepID=A0A859FE76_9BACI|nr:adenine deaminase [Paenalkalicoccus suaedae]QKS70535.1 adenine deaminase [Paenalkalicoccus suaedae]